MTFKIYFYRKTMCAVLMATHDYHMIKISGEAIKCEDGGVVVMKPQNFSNKN